MIITHALNQKLIMSLHCSLKVYNCRARLIPLCMVNLAPSGEIGCQVSSAVNENGNGILVASLSVLAMFTSGVYHVA